MQRLKSLFLVGFAVSALWSSPVRADGAINLLMFQANLLGVYQTGTSTYSGQVAWIPSLGLGGVGLRGELGFTLLKNRLNDRFMVLNYEAFLTLPIIPAVFTMEAGGGLETWAAGNGGTQPIVSVYAVMGVPGILQRAFLGYSRFLLPGAAANEFKLGLGFSL